LRWIVERCHAKAPEDRYASSRDLARELASLRDHLSEASASGGFGVAPAPRRFVRRWLLPAALVLLAGIGLGFLLRPRHEDVRFRRLTFRTGHVESARFAPDGKTILYSGSYDEKPSQIFSTRVDSAESTELPLPPADILALSSSGKMAICLLGGPKLILGEVSLAGGAPRQILEAVSLWADWSPDGRGLAVAFSPSFPVSGRLEFPPGQVLYERPGDGLIGARFSPDGKAIAFISQTYENRIMLIDVATKKVRVLSAGLEFALGLSWHPKTGEVWFSARDFASADTSFPIYAVSLSGRRRVVARAPANLLVQDVSRDSRVLFTDNDFRRSMWCLPPGASKEVDLTWHDFSNGVDISDDGSVVLFDEIAAAYGALGAVYLRKTDGSPAVRLGDGLAAALSTDGKWALATSSKADQLVLLPTGVGEPRTLPGKDLTYLAADFFPDGNRILFSAQSSGSPARLFVQDLAGGDPRPVGPEGASIGPVSPDGRWIALRSADGGVVLHPVGGGEPRRLPGVGADEKVLRWDAMGEALFVMKTGGPMRIDRLVLASGRREFWKEIPHGAGDLESVRLTPDGKSYVYTTGTSRSDLWLADGLR
jgi:Tol biopolymer transport system component